MSDERTFDAAVRERFLSDAAALQRRLEERAGGAARARRRGARRRRAGRAALAVCTAVLLTAVGITARTLSRQQVPVEQRPVGTTAPTTDVVEVVGPTTTSAAPTTLPPVTVAPDPSGAGALPIAWNEVPGDVAGLGITATDASGVTYSLYDTAAADPSGPSTGQSVSIGLARTVDGTEWERLDPMPWASSIASDGDEILVAGRSPAAGGRPSVRVARSSDHGGTWTAQDVAIPDGIDAPTINPLPGGRLVPMPPLRRDPTGPATTIALEEQFGSWSIEAGQTAMPELIAGRQAVLLVIGVQRSADGPIPQCSGERSVSTPYWYSYRDGITVELKASPGGFPAQYTGRVVPAGEPEPAELVRCNVAGDALAEADAVTIQATTTWETAVLRASGEGWVRLDSDLPSATRWRIMAMGDHFLAVEEASGNGSAPRVLRSIDGERWEDVERPLNWPNELGDTERSGGQRAIGLDRELGQVATSLDGGRTWSRVDIRGIAIPDGPVNPGALQLGETRATPNGFVLRYIVAEGGRFWRVFATSHDGITWAAVDESPLFWTGPLGPRLAVVGDRILMTTNDSAPTSMTPLVIGFTTRSYLGRPTG